MKVVTISLTSDDLQLALGIASKVAPPLGESITLKSEGGRLQLFSLSELARYQGVVPAQVSGDCEFSLPLEALRDATKGRKELELKWDGNILNITTPGYKADLLTSDPLGRDELDKVEATELTLSAEHGVWLRSAIAGVALRPTAILSNYMPVTVKLTSKGAFVACYDTQHMAFTNSGEVTGNLSFTLPLDKMQTILDVFANVSMKIRLSSSRVEIRNKLAVVSMSLPSMDDTISADDVISKAKEAAKAKGVALTLPADKVNAFLENARSVMGKERGEIIGTCEGTSLKLFIQTVRGKVAASIKSSTKGSVKFKVDFDYFQELA